MSPQGQLQETGPGNRAEQERNVDANGDSVNPVRRTRIYLVRRGEADWNRDGRLCTTTDRPLTALGRDHAASLGRRFAALRFASAVASPLSRAAETARIVLEAAGQPLLPVRTDERLVEVAFGALEGLTEDEVWAHPLGRRWRRGELVDIPDMETDAAAADRARIVWEDLANLPGPTLVVSHGYFIRTLLAVCVLGLPLGGARRLRIRNCRAAIVEPGATPLLLALNVDSPRCWMSNPQAEPRD